MKNFRITALLFIAFCAWSTNLQAQIPIVLGDDFISVPPNVTSDISIVFANDLVLDSSNLASAFYGNSTPVHGAMSLCPPPLVCVVGSQYTPDLNYVGADSCFYYISVQNGGAIYNDTAWIFFNVASSTCNLTFGFDVQPASPSPTGICTGGSIEVLNPSGQAPYSYSIDGGFTFQTSPLFSALDEGLYDLKIVDANACEANATILVSCDSSFNTTCTSAFSFATNADTVSFTDASFSMLGAPNPIVSWHWDFGDNSISSLQNPVHVFSPSNSSYNVCLTITFSDGCSDSYCETIAIGSVSCTADFTFIVNGLSVIFEGSTTWIGATPINYTWSFEGPAGPTGSGQTVTHTYPASGTYTVCMTTGSDCPNTICKQISLGTNTCIDSSLINPNSSCPTVVLPVCGCNGQTYNNDCEASAFYGVSSVTQGACISPVWPGDTDFDGVVTNFDLLPIGLAYGYSGSQRPNATPNWLAQDAMNWSSEFNAVNSKHADTDGNGWVDSLDQAAISLNYGLTHSKQEAKSGTGPELVPNFMGLTSISAGSIVYASIDFGTIDTPVIDAYGVAYSIEYDPTIINDSSFTFDFSNSWFASNSSNLNLVKIISNPGRLDIAQTRTNHANVSGFGSLNYLSFVIQEDLAGKTAEQLNLLLKVSNLRVLDRDGLELDAKTGEASLEIDLANAVNNRIDERVVLYPNPTKGIINVLSDLDIIHIEVSDMLGRKVALSAFDGKHLDLGKQAPGFYFIKIQSKDGEAIKKVLLN